MAASAAGCEWGARTAVIDGREVGGLVLAYGLGLGPMVFAMLLFESGYYERGRWVVLASVIPCWYAFGRWLTLAREFRGIRDQASVPAFLLIAGIIGIIGWQVSLWIRLRRSAVVAEMEARAVAPPVDTAADKAADETAVSEDTRPEESESAAVSRR